MNAHWFHKIAFGFSFCGILFVGSKGMAQSVIDLSKPVSKSLKPDGIYWTFDQAVETESGSAIVEDSSGNDYHGKLLTGDLHPAPTFVEGRFGKALHFQGNTPSWINEKGQTRTRQNPRVTWKLSDTPAAWDEGKLDMAGCSFTGGAWVRFDEINSGNTQSVTIFDRGLPIEKANWGFVLLKTPNDQWEFRAMGIRSTGKSEALNDQQWHHVAFSLNVSDGKGEVTFWLDGQRLGEPVATPSVIASITDSARGRILTVGERNVGNFSTGFIGAIDDVFVTTGALSFEPAK